MLFGDKQDSMPCEREHKIITEYPYHFILNRGESYE